LERDEGEPNWRNFKEYINLRFGPSIRHNPLGELKELIQTGSVEEYQQRFLAILCRADRLQPKMQVQLFTPGLREPIRTDVELQNPASLQMAMALARAYEKRTQVTDPVQFPPHPLVAPATTTTAPKPHVPHPSASATGGSTTAAPHPPSTGGQRKVMRRRFLTPAEMAERREQGLCFNCEEKFTPSHRCKRLFLLLSPSDGSDDEELILEDDRPGISLYALTGIQPRASQTMQLQVHVGNTPLLALLDSGSTHNFITPEAAKRAGIAITPRRGLRVVVANGDRVASSGLCPGVPVKINDYNFTFDGYTLPLDGFDIVLGIQWLRTLGPILWDFNTLSMSFCKDNQQVQWHGIGTASQPRSCHISDAELMGALLSGFVDLFRTPIELPPEWPHDHHIHLLPGTAPVSVRPYRYAHNLKDELERQCGEMLRQGIIRVSNSAYTSPVLLVKKQDGSWRFCVDYRALNDKTIKDKFPIPVVDELLDELRGSKYFTKLDLRSGYHQVRMHPPDIEKTAFRTHEGLFEFLVMPFGLTNAPATFQALMNDVLCPYLRCFVLVFFDDILIFSPSWSEHLGHVHAVMRLLRQHKLFLKRSKCRFGDTSGLLRAHHLS
jgi:hypothetical protein